MVDEKDNVLHTAQLHEPTTGNTSAFTEAKGAWQILKKNCQQTEDIRQFYEH